MAHTTAANKPITKDRIQFNDIIAFIFIILFLSVGGSKFFELEKFKKTFEFIPLLRPFAWGLAILVPIIEVITALLFLKEKYRMTAMVISAVLMLSFTVFTIFITEYAGTTPCTCGGVIQHLSWKQHLYLNASLLTLTILGILFPLKYSVDINHNGKNQTKIKSRGNLRSLLNIKFIIAILISVTGISFRYKFDCTYWYRSSNGLTQSVLTPCCTGTMIQCTIVTTSSGMPVHHGLFQDQQLMNPARHN